jgi:hypothetical protein
MSLKVDENFEKITHEQIMRQIAFLRRTTTRPNEGIALMLLTTTFLCKDRSKHDQLIVLQRLAELLEIELMMFVTEETLQ